MAYLFALSLLLAVGCDHYITYGNRTRDLRLKRHLSTTELMCHQQHGKNEVFSERSERDCPEGKKEGNGFK